MGSSIFTLSDHINHFLWRCRILTLTLIVASLPWLVLCTDFEVLAFSSLDGFSTLGDAHHVPENLSVNINSDVTSANIEGHTSGRLTFTKELVQMRDTASLSVLSFSTLFTFSITQGEGTNRSGWGIQGSGFAFSFTTTNMSSGVDNYYKKGRSMEESARILIRSLGKCFAVEFDTFNNYLYNDPSDNHIGIDVNSVVSIHTYNLCGDQVSKCHFPWTGHLYTAWIEYNIASPLLLEVWLANGSLVDGVSKPREAIIRVPKLDLFDIFEDYMYVGIFADSGDQNDITTILSWKFTSNLLKAMTIEQVQLSIKTIILMILSVCCVLLLSTLMSKYWWRHQCHSIKVPSNLNQLIGIQSFAYKDLKEATKNFNENAILGSGGFGIVYKGILQTSSSSTIVAIKRFKHIKSENDIKTFLAEASSVSQIRHRNLIQLQGWCHEDNHFLLVFDYMSNGSLDEWLFPKRRSHPNDPKYKKFGGVLPWTLRCSILGGIAAALEYLHEECMQCILHRDIKSSNVMLDNDMNPHLGDFGLARLVDHNKLEKTTLVAGTFSYMAPELLYTRKATKESDVYSFGILMLEVICGKQPLNLQEDCFDDDMVLLQSVWRAHEANNILSVVDPKILTLKSCLQMESPHTSKPTSGQSSSRSNSMHITSSNSMLGPSNQIIGDDSKDCFDISHNFIFETKQSLKVDEEKKMMHLLYLGMICCLPNPEARPSIRVVKQMIKELNNTCESSTKMLNLMSNLPSKRPISPYLQAPAPIVIQPLPNITKPSSKRRRQSYRCNTQSLLTRANIGHELP